MIRSNASRKSIWTKSLMDTWSTPKVGQVGHMATVAGLVVGNISIAHWPVLELRSYLGQLKKAWWLVVLASMWGSSYMFVKIGVSEIPPMTFAMGRAALGASMLYLVLRLHGRRLPKWGSIWKHLAVVALVHNAAPYGLVAVGGQYIDSGLAAIITGSTPLFTIILAHFLVADDRLTPAKLLGVLVGLGGLLLLILPTVTTGIQTTRGGVLAVLFAAVCYAIALVYSRKHLRGLVPLAAPTAQLMLAAIYMLPLSLIIDHPFSLPTPSWPAVNALLGVSVLGTALGFMIFYKLVEIANPTYVSMVSYLIPVVGMSLGAIVLGEQLTWNIWIGFAIILAGVLTTNGSLNRYLPRGLKQNGLEITVRELNTYKVRSS